MYNKIDSLINKIPTADLSATSVKDGLIDKLNSFDTQNPGFLQKSGFGSVQDYNNNLNSAVKESQLYQNYAKQGIGNFNLTNPLQAAKALGQAAFGPGVGSRVGEMINRAGSMARSTLQIGGSPEQIAAGISTGEGQKLLDTGFKNMYQANPQDLESFGSKLINNEATKYIGQSLLKGIKDGDRYTVNAAIFSALQKSCCKKAS